MELYDKHFFSMEVNPGLSMSHCSKMHKFPIVVSGLDQWQLALLVHDIKQNQGLLRLRNYPKRN